MGRLVPPNAMAPVFAAVPKPPAPAVVPAVPNKPPVVPEVVAAGAPNFDPKRPPPPVVPAPKPEVAGVLPNPNAADVFVVAAVLADPKSPPPVAVAPKAGLAAPKEAPGFCPKAGGS